MHISNAPVAEQSHPFSALATTRGERPVLAAVGKRLTEMDTDALVFLHRISRRQLLEHVYGDELRKLTGGLLMIRLEVRRRGLDPQTLL
ncbi:hypothetical protein [Azospirillum sp. SYSU D00513]|uniref:hypothetical protein n=1 Tax=Azospirillum sp. SYSU D00513 TaxID=2812561 RepID=UPI001A95AD5F|nr:hypothetical protein [Azospirillum sp. SYSU D00513]